MTARAHGDATYSNNNWTVQSDSNKSALSFQPSTSVRPSWGAGMVFKGTASCL